MGFIDLIIKDSEGKSERDLLHQILHRLYHIEEKQDLLILKIKEIMSAQDDFVQALNDLKTEVDGISTKVAALEAAINGQPTGTVAQPILDAFAALKGSVDTLNTAADNTPATPPAPTA